MSSRDWQAVAWHRLQTAVIPHVAHDGELRRRLIACERYRQGLPVVIQHMLDDEMRAATMLREVR